MITPGPCEWLAERQPGCEWWRRDGGELETSNPGLHGSSGRLEGLGKVRVKQGEGVLGLHGAIHSGGTGGTTRVARGAAR